MISDLTQWMTGQLEAGRPALLRLSGAGGPLAAVRLLRKAPRLSPTVAFGELPDEGAFWFHEGEGVVAHAEAVIAWVELLPRPVVIILTGEAVKAGAPQLGKEATFGSGLAAEGWTRVDVPWALHSDPAVLEDEIRNLEARGDLLAAHGRWETLCRVDPVRGGNMRWIEVQRLGMAGRSAEVMDAILDGKSPYDDHSRLLFQSAAANYRMGRVARFRSGMRALMSDGVEADVAADAAAVLGWIARAPSATKPEGTLWRKALATAMVALHHEEGRAWLGALPDGPWVGLMRDFVDRRGGEEQVACAVRLGHMREAARIVRRARGVSPATIAYSDFLPEALITKTGALLDQKQLGQAGEMLAKIPAEARETRDVWGSVVPLYSMVLAAHARQRTAMLTAIAKAKQRVDGVYHRHSLSRVPAWLEDAPHWARARGLGFALETATDVPTVRDVREALRRMEPSPVILDNYRLDRSLADGGMGEVWLATHMAYSQRVAVKVIKHGAGDRVEEAFRREVELTSRLEHPSIVAVLDFGVVPLATELQSNGRIVAGQPFLVMELVEHGTLDDEIGEISWPDLHAVLVSLLDALSYAHARGVLHRDIKPANVLVTEDGDVRLTDFGLAALPTGRVAGTPPYMAPEQFTGGVLDGTCDLYGLAMMTWEMLTGSAPFLGSVMEIRHAHVAAPRPPLAARKPVPVGLEAWLHRMMHKAPEARFQSATAALQALLDLGPAVAGRVVAQQPAVATFALETEVDLGPTSAGYEVRFGCDDVSVLVPELADVELTRSHRPRLPTERMMDRGDPPYVGHMTPRAQLWRLFVTVAKTRKPAVVFLRGPQGVGRKQMLDWLRLTARRQGLAVSDLPGPALAVIDAGNEPWERWKELLADAPPWLVVFTGTTQVPDAEVIEVGTVDFFDMYELAMTRVPLDPHTAGVAAVRAVGRPALLFSLLGGWRSDPGFGTGPRGLVLHPSPSSINRAAEDWWRELLRGLPAADRSGLSLAAFLFPDFRLETLQAVLNAAQIEVETDLVDLLITDGKSFQMPPELRSILVREERRPAAVHQLLGSVPHAEPNGSFRRWTHAALGGHPSAAMHLVEEVVGLYHARNAEPPTPAMTSGALLALDLALDADLDTRLWLRLAHARATVRIQRNEGDRLLAAIHQEAVEAGFGTLAAMAVEVRLTASSGLSPNHQHVNDVPEDQRNTAFQSAVAYALCRSGKRVEAEIIWERLTDELRAEDPYSPMLGHVTMNWARSLGEAPEAFGLYLLATRTRIAGISLAFVHGNLAHLHLLRGDLQEAYDSASLALDANPKVITARLNRVVAGILLGHDTRQDAELAFRFALAQGVTSLIDASVLLCLASHPDWPDHRWDPFIAMARPVVDRPMHTALLLAIDTWPHGPRRREISELAAACEPES